jgi:signal transduction histidine kinase
MLGLRPSAKGSGIGAPVGLELTVPGALTRRVLGACLVVTVVVGLVFVLLLRSLATQREAVGLSLHSRNVLSSADEVERLVIDLETGVRGYLLTGEESFLEPWTAARLAIGPEVANLQRLALVPEQHARSVRLGEAIDSYIDDYSVPLVEAARRGDPAAGSIAATADGKQRVDEIRGLSQDLRTAERRLLSSRDADSLSSTKQTLIAASAGLGVSVAVTLLLAAYWTRSIVRPVLRTARMANRLAGGDLSTRVPETGVGEIRTLERSFNQMASSMAELLKEQSALRQVATLVARGEPPDAVFAAVVEQAATVLDVDAVTLVRREPDGTVMVLATWGMGDALAAAGERWSISGSNATSQAFHTGAIARQENFTGPEGSIGAAAHELGVRLSVAAPIVVEGVIWGAMVIATMRPRQSGEIDARLGQFTDLVATTIANSQAREDLAASRARLVAASDETRRRIERDLHDGIQQRLVSLALNLRLVEDRVADDQPWLRGKLAEVAGELDATITELRELCRGIHPAILSKGGLGSALKALARRSPVLVDVDLRLGSRPSLTVEAAAYYVVAEALTNATKHAQASEVRIEAANRDGLLELLIVDDGMGGADPQTGSGLTGLMDRVDALGGRMEISSPPGQGTRMLVELPVTYESPPRGPAHSLSGVRDPGPTK